MQTPSISRALAIALCEDEFTGIPALDDPSWQGATDSARASWYDESPHNEGHVWCFCWDDETGRLEAINAETGEGCFWGTDGWEAR